MLRFFYYLENFIWLFPAIRQRKNRFNYYFIILAISGLAEVILLLLNIRVGFNGIAMLCSLQILMHSFTSPKAKIVRNILYVPSLSLLYLMELSPFKKYFAEVFLIMHAIILFIFIRKFLLEAVQFRAYGVFLASLVIYELSLTIRLFFAVTGTEIGYSYYIISMILETGVGLFFILFSEDDPRLAIRMKI